MGLYAYEKPAAEGQAVCESENCKSANMPGGAFCPKHYDKMKKVVEGILAPRKAERLVVSAAGVVRAADGNGLRKNNPRSERTRGDHRYWRYGLTTEQFDRIKKQQGNRCAICGESGDVKKLHIDHDHACCPSGRSCGACVRGLLCVRCNTALAVIENIAFMEAAMAYLADFPSRKALLK